MSHVDDGKLHTYLDGASGDRERQQIEAHLSGCEVCRERLEEARASSRRASDLLAQLEPAAVQAPPWDELEQRAAARQQNGPRQTWVRPSLAWAAVIALAFGVGWLSNSYMSRAPDSLGTTALQDAPASDLSRSKGEAVPNEAIPIERPETVAGRAAGGEPEVLAEGALRAEEEQLASRSRGQQAPAETPAEVAPAKTEEAGGAVAGVESDDRLAAAPRRDKQTEAADEFKAAEAEPRAATFADREAPEPEDARRALAQPTAFEVAEFDEVLPGQFVSVSENEAAAWMGVALRTLPELQLVSAEVGPGSAVAGGLQGLPAIKLTYLDAAGHVIVLIQQRTRDAELLAEETDPTLVVDPTGLNTYRWHDEMGYRLMLLGEVSGDSLRALADRVR